MVEPSAHGTQQTSASTTASTRGVGGLFTGGGWMTGIVSGGLDVLETLGKKTFETLTTKDEVRYLFPLKKD